MINEDWWPDSLSHIPREQPWDGDNVIVAEIRSYNYESHTGYRRLFSALIPTSEIEEVSASLAKLSHEVETSGPHPYFSRGDPYRPSFWVRGVDLPSEKYEPLVLSWTSHDKTVLHPDPGFLMTYGLTPRQRRDGWTSWDDPAAPKHDVVMVSAPSVWDFPTASDAVVTISKAYLEDYLSLRDMSLLHIFWEQRYGRTDDEIEEQFGGEEAVALKFADREFQLNRSYDDRNTISAQVWGGRVIAHPTVLPISEDSLDIEGLSWPGFEEPITSKVAASRNPADCVYVNDEVLGEYEGKPGFSIIPEVGSVSFGTQWGVGFCRRIGRGLIQVELKKIYEGVPPHTTRHWHKFAVLPLNEVAYTAALGEKNIALRAKAITYSLLELGENLAGLSEFVGYRGKSEEDYVGLRKQALEYSGWWSFDDTESISRHAPINMSADNFLDRCLSLIKLLVEGLSEKHLRQLLLQIGLPAKDIATLRVLKLLDCIARLAYLADSTGLDLSSDGEAIWERLGRDGVTPAQPIAHLFALYDLRLIKAHRAGNRDAKLSANLERFGIAPGEEAAGYGLILDRIYDVIEVQIKEVSAKIGSVIAR